MIFCLMLWVNRMEQTCQRLSKYAINSSSAMEIQSSAKMLQWYPVTLDQNRINFDARWSGHFMYMYTIVYQTLRSWILNHEYADFSFGFLWVPLRLQWLLLLLVTWWPPRTDRPWQSCHSLSFGSWKKSGAIHLLIWKINDNYIYLST